MHCEQARQLFDAYLDGELSPSLATELGAHQVRCPECRQALALLEVSGHILRSDRDSVTASADFTDRLLACVDGPRAWRRKLWNSLYIGGPLAAAAVIALAFLGVFDGRGKSQVAGVQQIIAAPAVEMVSEVSESRAKEPASASGLEANVAERALDEFVEQTQDRMRENGESIQRVLDLTILQMLDILEEAKERSDRAGGQPPDLEAPPALVDPAVESAKDADDAPSPERNDSEESSHPDNADESGGA